MTRLPVKALIFDLDGTLYDQRPLRRAMLSRLIAAHLVAPREGLFTMRSLRAYRRAQEALRDAVADTSLADHQLSRAAEAAGVDPERMRACVERWMEREPLPLLARCRRPGLVELLQRAQELSIDLAVVSDYPARAKLEALEVDHFFQHVVTAQDRDVQRFKPDPRGLQVTLARLGVAPEDALYVGDRPEVDGEAARRAGIRFLIIGKHASGTVAEHACAVDFRGVAGLLEPIGGAK